MGRALATLRDANIAIVGSGFASFHNLRLMFPLMQGGGGADPALVGKAKAWNAALTAAVTGGDSLDERAAALAKWRDFPHAYDMHPRHGAEHFLPLLVCVGAGGDDKGRGYVDDFLGLDIWSFYWD